MVGSHVSKKAKEALAYFEKANRTNGVEFWKVKDGAPQWVTDLCFASHSEGAMLPDDWRYVFIVEALVALEEEIDLEPDIYTSELCAWLASNVNRVGYVDDARNEWGGDLKSIFDELQLGQLTEKREVFDQVTAFLEALIEEGRE